MESMANTGKQRISLANVRKVLKAKEQRNPGTILPGSYTGTQYPRGVQAKLSNAFESLSEINEENEESFTQVKAKASFTNLKLISADLAHPTDMRFLQYAYNPRPDESCYLCGPDRHSAHAHPTGANRVEDAGTLYDKSTIRAKVRSKRVGETKTTNRAADKTDKSDLTDLKAQIAILTNLVIKNKSIYIFPTFSNEIQTKEEFLDFLQGLIER